MEVRAAGGNVSEELKEEMTEMIGIVMKGERFARQTLSRMRLLEMWVTVRPEDGKRQARTVFEIEVDRGGWSLLHPPLFLLGIRCSSYGLFAIHYSCSVGRRSAHLI